MTHTHSQCIAQQDDGIRPDTSVAALSKLKPAFAKDGTTTAGNSSQVSDGAAAVLLARASTAAALQLPVLAVLRSYAVVGVPPDVMGIGPAFAIPEAVRKAGLTLNDIDVFEINEAFASQVALTLLLTLSFRWGRRGFPRWLRLTLVALPSPPSSCQAVYCIRHLGLPADKVNPLGGAIALGHPLGATGTRLVVTLVHHLQRTGKVGTCACDPPSSPPL